MQRPILACLMLLPLAVPPHAHAQTFQCTEATAGQLSCQAGVACECRFAQASAMDGTPAGWRWDCGILRPHCGEPVPATIEDYSDALPDVLSIDRQTLDVDINQSNEQLQWIAPEVDF
ncbi:MAG: hypothetical protein R3F55_24855 [Alphaproteobacteria bacterium]